MSDSVFHMWNLFVQMDVNEMNILWIVELGDVDASS